MSKSSGQTDQIKQLPPESLTPYERNNKLHGDTEIERIANSIVEFGWTYPILIDENRVVLAGHKRLLAAKKLGLTEVPTLTKSGLTETQKDAYRIIDNKSSEESAWNFESITLELDRLAEMKFDMDQFCDLRMFTHPIEIDSAPESDDSPLDEQKFLVVIEVFSESEQRDLYEELTARGLKCKIIT